MEEKGETQQISAGKTQWPSGGEGSHGSSSPEAETDSGPQLSFSFWFRAESVTLEWCHPYGAEGGGGPLPASGNLVPLTKAGRITFLDSCNSESCQVDNRC